MPDIDDLRRRYQELSEIIREQNRLRDSGSDDYDLDALEQATRDRFRIEMEHQEAGGSLDDLRKPSERPDSESTTGEGNRTGGSSSSSAEPTTPDPNASTAEQLSRQIEALEGQQPHPGVRLNTETHQVIGGTREQFDENERWRQQLERLEHERAAAEAEEAWNAAGGAGSFTKRERANFQHHKKEIDGLQDDLAGVNKRIEHWEGLRRQAGEKLEGGRSGNHPGAGGAAGVAAGARYDAELRTLYAEQSRLEMALSREYGELNGAVGQAINRQREGASVEIDLPADRVGREEV